MKFVLYLYYQKFKTNNYDVNKCNVQSAAKFR